jgi:hypothetical protein
MFNKNSLTFFRKSLIIVFACATALLGSSCVKLVTPESAPIRVNYRSSSPVSVSVVDERVNASGGKLKDRYLGRCRLGFYGIPTSILDPKMNISQRVYEQIKVGFAQKGVEVTPADSGSVKTLVIRIKDDTWIDFANPLYGKESILYFNATAEVVSNGKARAGAQSKFERKFRYDVNDSLFNQAILTLQPEFSKLLNEPKIQSALVP